MELDIGVAVPVLDADYKASHWCHSRKVAERFLVRVLGILLTGGYELVVEVKVYAVTSREVAAEQRGEDVAVTESEKSAAKAEGPVDDIPYAGLVECLENWK